QPRQFFGRHAGLLAEGAQRPEQRPVFADEEGRRRRRCQTVAFCRVPGRHRTLHFRGISQSAVLTRRLFLFPPGSHALTSSLLVNRQVRTWLPFRMSASPRRNCCRVRLIRKDGRERTRPSSTLSKGLSRISREQAVWEVLDGPSRPSP